MTQRSQLLGQSNWKGVETIDVASGQKFNMRAMVLWTINDFPARSSLSGWSGQGYKACPTCNKDTPSVRVYVQRQASDTQEYPSLIDAFWRTHTVDGIFPKDEDRRIYEEMKRLEEATGEYTEDEINALARGGKLRGHIPGVGRVLPSRVTSRPSMPAPDKLLKSMHRKVDYMGQFSKKLRILKTCELVSHMGLIVHCCGIRKP